MRRISGHFEDLHFTESHLGPPSVEEGVLKVPVSGLLTLRGHPLCDGTLNPITGYLIFNGFSRSVRKITEYVGDPRNPLGFKEEYEVEDVFPIGQDAGGTIYLFEGVMSEPVAWVEWEVRAKDFELICC
ncbi:hypothetical protein ACQVRV_20940 (plasmid) [Ralstonia pseudosolanacearum]